MSADPNDLGDDGVLFECRTCHEEPCAPRLDDLSAWARLCGYDSTCIRLCEEIQDPVARTIHDDVELSARPGRFEGWMARRCHVRAVQPPFLETSPEAGKSYIACVSHPFIAKPGEPFWFLFQPAFTLLNGWEENPEEIYSSRLVHAVFDRVLQRDKEFALIVVTVQEMLSVSAIHDHFPETTDEKIYAMFDDEFARRSAWVRYLNFVYVYWDLEGDVGVWWLFRQDQPLAHEPARLVLQGHWGWHDALIWAGNYRLSAAEAAHLHSFMLR